MKQRFLGVALLLITALTACGGGRGSDGQPDNALLIGGPDGRGSLIRPGLDANAAYSEGVDLRAKGDCRAAVVKLRGPASIGPGYENAQTALGDCLLRTAGNSDLSSDYLEGLTWLTRAADGGFPEAQAILADTHINGPTTLRNPQEAAYWLALYDTNPGKARIGFIPYDAAALAAIRAKISPADKAAGEKRAAAWVRKVWLPPTGGGGPSLQRRNVRIPQQMPG